MTVADQMREHQGRCQPHLLRLRMLARCEAGTALPWRVAAEVREATSAVIAEAEAASRAALAAMAGTRRQAEDETFLWVRLTRLARAADEAADAAHGRDASGLRRHLGRFDALTDALWTVQHAVCVQAPAAPGQPALPAGRQVPARVHRGCRHASGSPAHTSAVSYLCS